MSYFTDGAVSLTSPRRWFLPCYMSYSIDLSETLGFPSVSSFSDTCLISLTGLLHSFSTGLGFFLDTCLISLTGLLHSFSTGLGSFPDTCLISLTGLLHSFSTGLGSFPDTCLISLTGLLHSFSTGLGSFPDTCLISLTGLLHSYSTGLGSLIPFITVYMKQLGLTSNETGVIYGVMPFLSFVVRPLVGSLADRWMKHKVVLIVCTVLTTVLHLLIMFVPPRAVANGVVHVKPAFLHCALNGSSLTSCLADVPGSEAGNHTVWFPGFEEEGVSPAAGCAATLEKFADEINGSADFHHHHHHTVVVVDDDGSGGVDPHDGVAANDSEARYRSVPPRLAADHYDFCSMACYRSAQDSASGRSLHVRHHGLTTSEEEEEEGTSSVCFSHDQVQPASLPTTQQQQQQQQQQRYCDGLRVDDLQPLRFNLTNPLRLFSGQRQGPSPPRRDNQSADFLLLECPSYPLLDVEFSARTYNTVTCPTPLTLACVMLCKGVPVVSVCDGGYAGASSLDLTLGLLMVLYFFASVAYAPILSIADAVIFDQLGPDHAHK